ncbi:MAG: aminoglycoside phosphotransferase [Solirubrobacterales bacterium]|nr:aminoglycoside phosphotransferase [Solirubrobacterales bacterium]
MNTVLQAGIVATRAQAATLDPPPLVVLENVVDALDAVGLGSGPVTAEPIAAGNSNLTFVIRRGDQILVLRRPPRPPYPPSTHDVLREHAILAACGPTEVRVPRAITAVGDPSIIGAPFYVMGYVAGVVITTALPAELQPPPARRAIGEELVDALAEIHALDWRAAGLESMYRGDDYPGRQLRRFAGLWETYEARALPAVSEAGRRLAAHRPPPSPPTLVHGDYRLGNVMFAADAPARLLAVLDWEMTAIGDPLADLGYLIATWAQPGNASGALLGLGAVSAQPGFATREELRVRYEQCTGRDTTWLPWYEALANWKSAVLLEGSYQRFVRGESDDEFFAGLASGVPALAERALVALDRVAA